MALDNINIGSTANDGTGDNIREAFGKVNTNNGKVLTNDVADYTTATTPLAGTEIALVEQGGTFKKVAVSEFGGSSKRSFTIEIPISQVLAASTSWWGRDTANQTIFNATFTQNAGWTPTNDFANISVQRTSNLVPFDCKIKTVLLKGFSNSVATDVRFCVVKSKGQSGGAIANSKIIADKTINTAGNIFEFEFTGTDLDTATIVLKGSEIRLVFFNNNVASNLFSTILLIEFEEL